MKSPDDSDSGLECSGCGSRESIEDIRAKHPQALSCCPERDMRPIIPPRLVHRPRDARGYVIPWVQFVAADGTPNFAVLDAAKTLQALRARWCGLCGHPLGKHLIFIGGPLCVKNRIFYDPPMHRDCAIYALRTCPHLATSKGRYRPNPPTAIDGAKIIEGDIDVPTKAEYFALMHATDMRWGHTKGGMLIAQASPWIDVEYWKDGKAVGPVPPVKDGAE